ncbi:integrase, catalytic region, zinc finger, CCHC-type containing protein [Tanacetum coccineum]
MDQFQVNTKFLNSLPPEWSKFVTDVKLVKDLHTSNFDQLHAYLEQHELHANEVRIMRERNQDPLAFVANQQMTPPHFNPYQSSYNNPQLQQQLPPSHHASIQPNQHYSSHYPSQTQFNHTSIPPSHTYQSQMNHQTSTVPQVIPQVAFQSPQAPTQLMTESPFVDFGFAVPVFSLRDDPIACLNKAMAFLMAVASLRFPTTNNQLRTSSNPRNQAIIQDGRGYRATSSGTTSSRGNTTSGQARVVKCYNCQGEGHMARQCTQPKRPRNAAWYKEKAMLAEAQEAGQILDEEQLAFLADPGIPAGQAQTIIPHNAAFQTEDLDTYDSDCDDLLTAQAVLMANISNYGSNVISEEKANKEQNNETITAELERYKERVKTFEQRLNIDLSSREKMIDSQMDDMIREKLALKEQVDSLEQNLSKQIKEKESVLQTFAVFKNKSKEKENKYMENEIDLEKKIKEIDNIICKVGQSAQLDVPSELPKVSLVNASLKKLKFHLAQFDSKVKKRTTPNALKEGKEIVENVVHTPSVTTIALGQVQVDLVRCLPRSCLYMFKITPCTKKVVVSPMNKVKKVRFAEPLTSSSNIKQVESSNTSDSNTPVVSSMEWNCCYNCRSKPPGNKD